MANDTLAWHLIGGREPDGNHGTYDSPFFVLMDGRTHFGSPFTD